MRGKSDEAHHYGRYCFPFQFDNFSEEAISFRSAVSGVRRDE